MSKVSAIYIHALEVKRQNSTAAGAIPDVEPIRLRGISDAELQTLGKRLAPPASPRKAPTRPIHPDLIVLVFTLVLPVFLAGIASNQAVMLFPMLALLAAAYGTYFWKRRDAIAKFERQQAAQKASVDRITRGIERWMRLYYCAEDDAVFEAGCRQSAPVDMISGYLLRD